MHHEMYHKDHWDKIKSIALTSGKSNAIVKAELEAPIQEYVSRQRSSDSGYIGKFVSRNAQVSIDKSNSPNEVIAEVFLQADKGKTKDELLADIVKRVTV